MDMFVRMEGNLNPYWHWGREVEDSVATAGKDGSAAEGWRTVMTLQITKLYTLKELKADVWTGCEAQTSPYTSPGFDSLVLWEKKKGFVRPKIWA